MNVILADLVNYINSLKNNSLDLLIVFDVLKHFTKNELSDLINECYRVLNQGGKVICHTPNAESPFGFHMREWDFTHEIAFTRESIAQLFLSHGFREVNSFEDEPIPHGIMSWGGFVLWKCFVRNVYRFFTIVSTGGCERNAIFSRNFLTVVIK